jgi:hypothetical protein|nr:MAG TPA: hypothetical protein [Caudoviricetes sp.]
MCKNRFTACLGRRPLGRANAFHLLRVFKERQQRRVGRDPQFIGSVRVIFLSGYAAPCLLLVTARLENLKFRSFENNKTRTLLCTGLKIHILWACEKPRKGNDLNYTPIAGKKQQAV